MQFKSVDLQVINPDLFYRGTRSERKNILRQLREHAVGYGLAIFWRPDITEADYDPLLDMMERYFAQSMEILQADVRSDIGRQVGLMEPYIECSKRYPEIRSKIKSEHQPFTHTGANPHMRFFHRYGPRPMHSAFPERHADPVIPQGFESEWVPKLDHWGAKTIELSFTVSEMLEHAFDLPYGTLAYRLDYAPHVVSPIGCDILELIARHAKMSPEELRIRLCEASDPIVLAEELEWNVDEVLEVLPSFRVNGWEERYPPTSVGEHSLKTISEIGLYTV